MGKFLYTLAWSLLDCDCLRRHISLSCARSDPKQEVQSFIGHVVGGRDNLCLAVGHVSVQRGGRHPRPDNKCSFHVVSTHTHVSIIVVAFQLTLVVFGSPPETWQDISKAATDLIGKLLQVASNKRYSVERTLQDRWLDVSCVGVHVFASLLTNLFPPSGLRGVV